SRSVIPPVSRCSGSGARSRIGDLSRWGLTRLVSRSLGGRVGLTAPNRPASQPAAIAPRRRVIKPNSTAPETVWLAWPAALLGLRPADTVARIAEPACEHPRGTYFPHVLSPGLRALHLCRLYPTEHHGAHVLCRIVGLVGGASRMRDVGLIYV